MNKHHIARTAAMLGIALAGWSGLVGHGAQAASIGTLLGDPRISGLIKPGELEEAKRDLTGKFANPLILRVDPDSYGREVMRIGLWLREQQPAIKLRGHCVGACAWFMLDSGRSLEVDKDSVIAFGMLPELWASVSEQLDAGALSIDDDRSSASVASFKAKFPEKIWTASAELREARRTQARTPEWIQQFVEGVTSFNVTQAVHDDDTYRMQFSSTRERCTWWVPDAEGLRQLGLNVPGYSPPSPARAAKVLGVSKKSIYIGPALRKPLAEPLCEGDPDFKLKLPRI